jgi:hypothetical protein
MMPRFIYVPLSFISACVAVVAVLLVLQKQPVSASTPNGSDVSTPTLTATSTIEPSLKLYAYLPLIFANRIQPTPTQAPTPTPTVKPSADITGSVLINGGNCCAGGIAGSTLTLTVAYSASSTAGEVTQLRNVNYYDGSVSDWRPFAATQQYTTTVFINWQGWYTCAQFRDVAGNISARVCDDIGIEGMPPPMANETPMPTPTPTLTPLSTFRPRIHLPPVRK